LHPSHALARRNEAASVMLTRSVDAVPEAAGLGISI
jgi:hypothetical protein